MSNFIKKIIYFGVDHLEVFGTFKEEKIFEKLDFDNSNYSEFGEYTLTKVEVQRYKYKIIFLKNNYTVFSYYKGKSKKDGNNISTKDYICIYSTAFKILSMEEIQALLKNFELKHFRRFDICLDLNIEIEDLLKFFKEPLSGKIYKKSGKIETKYFGEVKNSLNKRQIIRIYDKIKDIMEKRKLKLFSDYLSLGNITRIELEVRQELAKNLPFEKLFDNSFLLGIFKNYVGKYSNILEEFQIENYTLYRKKIDSEEFQSNFYKIKKFKNFVGYARNLFSMGFCPVRILIGEGIIDEKTKNILGIENIHQIIKKEAKIREEHYYEQYLKEKMPQLLENYYKYGKI